MAISDFFKKKKNTRKNPNPEKKEAKVRVKSPKEIATEKGEPWVDVIQLEIDENNPKEGAFELDWNEHFVAKLYRAGYYVEGDDDQKMVERWFNDVCRNVVMESYEQEMADPAKRGPQVQRTQRNDGKTEYK